MVTFINILLEILHYHSKYKHLLRLYFATLKTFLIPAITSNGLSQSCSLIPYSRAIHDILSQVLDLFFNNWNLHQLNKANYTDHNRVDPRLFGTRRLMMLTPDNSSSTNKKNVQELIWQPESLSPTLYLKTLSWSPQRSSGLLSIECMLGCFSHVQLSAALWTIVWQVPLSMGFSRQEY